jgi:hypothetical protein
MGSSLGQVLGGSPLLMRNWWPESDGQQNLGLFIEATVVGVVVLSTYAFALFEIIQKLSSWVHFLTF